MRRWLNAASGGLAAAALLAIMLLTLADVLGRKLASRSIPGALELTEILMVVVIFASLPLVSLHGEHVVFDSLDGWWSRSMRRLQQALVDAVCAAALAALAWLMWAKAGQVAGYGDTTAQLQWPVAPFVRLMAIACALAAAVHAVRGSRLHREPLLAPPRRSPSDRA